MATQINNISQDPVVSRFLEKMPEHAVDFFTEEQLLNIRNALGTREWGRHKVDQIVTIKLFKWRYYYVVLAGRNRRTLSEKELRVAMYLNAFLLTSFITFSILLGLIVLYLVKSALGLNLIEGWSLGLWGWFKANVLG